MTPQEIFDTACKGVIAQGRPSLSTDGNCFYRGRNGLKCAAGHLIPDEDYCPSMEYHDAKDLSFFRGFENLDLIQALQKAHDDDFPSGERFLGVFKRRARDIAERWGLSTDVLEEST